MPAWTAPWPGIASFWARLLPWRRRAGDNTNMRKTAPQIRDEINALVRQYYEVALAPQAFTPGQSNVPVSGKVLDSSDLEHLVEASLDAWLTTGRFAARFERDFAAFMGVRCASRSEEH